MMQRDEKEVLADWLAYHAHLLGAKYLYVVDNNSTHPSVIDTLDSWSKKGVHVQFADQQLKGRNRYENEWIKNITSQDPAAMFIVPIDADEFIVSATGKTYSTDVEVIRAEFKSLPKDGFSFKFVRFDAGFCHDRRNLTGRRIVDARHFHRKQRACNDKTFYYKPTLVDVGLGHHIGATSMDHECAVQQLEYHCGAHLCFHTPKLGLFHFGHPNAMIYTGYRDKYLRGFQSSRGIDPHAHNGTVECLEVSWHYCQFFNRWKTVGDAAMAKRFESVFHIPGCGHDTYTDLLANAVLEQGRANRTRS
jgi:hypothetical protein